MGRECEIQILVQYIVESKDQTSFDNNWYHAKQSTIKHSSTRIQYLGNQCQSLQAVGTQQKKKLISVRDDS